MMMTQFKPYLLKFIWLALVVSLVVPADTASWEFPGFGHCKHSKDL